MKILLLNAPPLKRFGIVGQIYPPLGILYLAAYIRNISADYEIAIVDGYHEKSIEDVINKITDFSPDILGVSFTTQAATGAYAVINQVRHKLRQSSVIMVGGPHPTIYPNEPLDRSKTDIVVMGEGEVIFLNLANKIKNNKDYSDTLGIAYKKDGSIIVNLPEPMIKNLDDIPFPARDLIDLKKYPGYHYKKREWDTSYLSSRGCPYHCVYCSNPVWKQQKPWIRWRSPKNIANEIEELKIKYNVREFYDQADLFNADINWSKKVCDEFMKQNLNIYWKVQMTVKNMDDELSFKMVKSGCWLGLLGIETGNDQTSRGINKRSDRETAERTLTILKKYGMKTFALLMAFNVWEEDGRLCYEDRAATLKTLNFAKEMIRKGKIDIISWSLTTPYPGSMLYDIAKRHKLIPKDLEGKWEYWDSSENFIMRLPGVSDRDWQFIKRKGKLLQALLLFKSGTFNWRSIPIYLKKAWNMICRRGR